MDKVVYSKRTYYNLFKFNFFSKTEIYSEISGDAGNQVIDIYVKPEYFDREFDINGGEGTSKGSN